MAVGIELAYLYRDIVSVIGCRHIVLLDVREEYSSGINCH